MNRIENRMQQLQNNHEKALITYITAGLPDMNVTGQLIRAQYEGGVDVIELGIPFSDPVADGPVIQAASYRSIQNGTNINKVFELMDEVRKDCEVPIVFMMYYNTIHHYGLDAFAERCIEAGVDGLIVPDLPFEEQGMLNRALKNAGDKTILIQLVSPVSGNRIPMLLENARGFVYCVSQMGVTGKGADFHQNVRDYLSQVKRSSRIPVMMGFGISKAQDVKPLADYLDGAIVGSAFIRLMEASDFSAAEAKKFVSEFKKELNVN